MQVWRQKSTFLFPTNELFHIVNFFDLKYWKRRRNQIFLWMDRYKSPIDILGMQTVRIGMQCETRQFS